MPIASYQAVVAAGERLIHAQEFERQCAELYCHHPEQKELMAAWMSARNLAEQLGSTYVELCDALRDGQACSYADADSDLHAVCQ